MTTDRLVEDLWPRNAPKTARHALHVYISRLRKMLGPASVCLERRGAGYRIDLVPDELDASRFEQLAAKGRTARARGDPHTAGEALREALGVWRGPALDESPMTRFAREEAMRLEVHQPSQPGWRFLPRSLCQVVSLLLADVGDH